MYVSRQSWILMNKKGLKALTVSGMLLITNAAFAAPAPPAPPQLPATPSLFSLAVKGVISLAVILGLIFLLFYLFRRFSHVLPYTPKAKIPLEIVGYLNLSQRTSIAAVQLHDRLYLLGITPDGIEALDVIDDPSFMEELGLVKGGFSKELKTLLEERGES